MLQCSRSSLASAPRAVRRASLLQQQTPLASAAQPKLAHQLLVSGLSAGGARNPRHQLTIRSSVDPTACPTIRHKSRVGHSGQEHHRNAAKRTGASFMQFKVLAIFSRVGHKWQPVAKVPAQARKMASRSLKIDSNARFSLDHEGIAFDFVAATGSPTGRLAGAPTFRFLGPAALAPALAAPSLQDRKGTHFERNVETQSDRYHSTPTPTPEPARPAPSASTDL